MARHFLQRLFWAPPRGTRPSAAIAAANITLVFLACVGCAAAVLVRSDLQWDWSAVGGYWRLFLNGWGTTLCVSAGALALSVLLGSLLALAQRSNFLPIRYCAEGYVGVVRGTPLLAQIYILFYIVADVVKLEDRTLSGILALSFFSAAYLAEMIRAGIDSVGRSQLESAMAIGLTRGQTYRHVILPQALRFILPSMAGQFVSLIKDSSLLSIIGINEMTQSARNVASYTFSNLESYLLLAAGYLLLTIPISLWTKHLENRFRYET
jgi:polar amino acid transport system permease protein